MKIALCQINPTVGAFKNNKELILHNYIESLNNGADLVVFPEMSITGYPISDLLYEDGFVDQNMIILDEIISKSTKPIVIGYIHQEEGRLFNSAAVCSNGKILFRYDKILLPTYDVFDEDRYFSPGKELGLFKININNKQIVIGLQICEDLWDHEYDRKISDELSKSGASFIINISASPYHSLKFNERIELIKNKVNKIKKPIYYCNLVGAQDELIFDGESIGINSHGKLVGLGKKFSEDIIYINSNSKTLISEPKIDRYSEIYNALVLGVRDYFHKTFHSEAVVGLSGGIDSSLVACIATDALGADKVHGVSLPSIISSDHSKSDAKNLASNLNIDFRSISIGSIVAEYEDTLKNEFRGTKKNVAEENIQARIRGDILMALSNKYNWLVLSTGNKTEMALGYCTLYGDMSGGLSVISDLSKDDVYALAHKINSIAGYDRIPENCINKLPSAELSEGQFDPFDYKIVSPLVDRIIEDCESPFTLIEDGYDAQLVYDIYNRIKINEYKRRQAAPGLRISSKAFGVGRRVPIVNHYKYQEE
tara:strand:- start:534 stop:2150 length:1617 start_codon:yes stop_codon:yes gene_type:complete